MAAAFLAFLGVSLLVIVTPGQDTALTIRNTLSGGRRSGVFTAVGVSGGQAVWTLAAVVGLTAILVASEPAFTALKLAGSAYLVWLGLQGLAGAFRRRGAVRAASGEGSAKPVTARLAFRQGLLSNLGNPKMAVFFTSLLPQFGGTSFLALFGLGLVFCFLTLVWLSCYAVAVAKAGHVLRRPAIRRALDAVTGVVLIALGLRLATERR
jgi:threonine/homoserine/homoserine lactone efflux protein